VLSEAELIDMHETFDAGCKSALHWSRCVLMKQECVTDSDISSESDPSSIVTVRIGFNNSSTRSD
jgi:hypothetical protein